jgi:hypothetical protein
MEREIHFERIGDEQERSSLLIKDVAYEDISTQDEDQKPKKKSQDEFNHYKLLRPAMLYLVSCIL